MKFSLIMGTVGRTNEIKRFLNSLKRQSYKNFELIIVDQNKDNKISSILNEYKHNFPIIYLKMDEFGLSKARNLGMRYISGDIIGFPDDDCIYPENLLENIVNILTINSEFDGVSGRALDEEGESFSRFHKKKGWITLFNVWQRTGSCVVFFRKRVIRHIGEFDETLGIGAQTPWQGAEDIDYVLRSVRTGFKIYFIPELIVYHPNPLKAGHQKMAERAYKYGAGIGRMWKKHNYPIFMVFYYLLRPLGGALLSKLYGHKSKAYYHWRAFQGRLKGWLSR